MTPNRAALPDRSWDPLRYQRGTRGFAAFLTLINGLVTLGVATVVAPASGMDATFVAWLGIGGLVAGVVQLAAVVGLMRGRLWARSAVAYPAAGGIGSAAFALLLITRAGEPVFGAADATAVGFLVWMIAAWLVATRFVLKAYGDPTLRPVVHRIELPAPTPAPTAIVSVRPRSAVLRGTAAAA